MIGGITLVRNQPSLRTLAAVRNSVPCPAKPRRSLARADMKLKIEYPTPVRRAKRAIRNCRSIPPMTGCQLMCFRLLDVAHSTKRMTKSPNKLTARLARVLSADSFEANDPTRMTAMATAAPVGVRHFGGMALLTLTPVRSQVHAMGSETTEIGTWKVSNRIEIHNQTRNGIIQFMSWR